MDKAVSYLWLMRGTYVLLAFAVVFLHLLPLNTRPDRWPFPDVMIALTFAWVLRRPDYVPMLVVAMVMLISDLLLQRPPGLLGRVGCAGDVLPSLGRAKHARHRVSGRVELGCSRHGCGLSSEPCVSVDLFGSASGAWPGYCSTDFDHRNLSRRSRL